MKTLQKSQSDKLPKVVIVKSKRVLKFPESYEPFAEKNARAKEALSKMKFPEGFFDRK